MLTTTIFIFVAVQKVSAIFFLSLVLVTQTPLQQVLKLPVLIEHFREHQKEYKDISFAAFIQLHYFSGNPKDEDYNRDQQLPFRSDAVILLDSSIAIAEYHLDLGTPPACCQQLYPLMNIATLPDRHGFDIWQPPKAC